MSLDDGLASLNVFGGDLSSLLNVSVNVVLGDLEGLSNPNVDIDLVGLLGGDVALPLLNERGGVGSESFPGVGGEWL